MDIARGKTAFQSGAAALGQAAGQVRQSAGEMADSAMYGVRRAGNEVGSFVQRRPVETALFGASAACLVAGLVVWFTRRD